MPAPEVLHQRPEIPFMPTWPEWDNLVAEDMAASVEAGISGQENPYVELNRTLSSLYALNNLYTHLSPDNPEVTSDDLSYDRIDHDASHEALYEMFTQGQNEDDKLPLDKYIDITDRTNRILNTPQKYRRMQYVMLASDPFKNPKMMHAFGFDPETVTHDTAVKECFTNPIYEPLCRQYFSSFFDDEKFNDEDRAEMRKIFGLMEFNFPGWAQSQASVGHLELLPEDLDPEIKLQFLLHGILDVMGVMGNRNVTAALAYNEPTHDMLTQAMDALTMPAEELQQEEFFFDTEITPEIRENIYFMMRCMYYGVTPFDIPNSPRIQQLFEETPAMAEIIAESNATAASFEAGLIVLATQELRAQIGLANMARYRTREQFAQLREAYHALPRSETEHITDILFRRKNYELDYGPAYVRELLGNSKEETKRGLQALDQMLDATNTAYNEMYADDYYQETRAYGVATPHSVGFSTTYSTNITVVCRELVERVRSDPNFFEHSQSIVMDRKGRTFIPRFATYDEIIDRWQRRSLELLERGGASLFLRRMAQGEPLPSEEH